MATPEREPLAIISLILGILSIPFLFATGFSLLFAVGAIVFGWFGLSRIKRDGTTGRNLAIWGIILGIIGIIMFIVIIAAIGTIGAALFRMID